MKSYLVNNEMFDNINISFTDLAIHIRQSGSATIVISKTSVPDMIRTLYKIWKENYVRK